MADNQDAIPVEATTFDFTPTAFKDRDDGPVFTLHYGTRRHRTRFQRLQIIERLVRHDERDVRDVVISEIKAMFEGDADDLKDAIDKTKAYWDASEHLEAELKSFMEHVGTLPDGLNDKDCPPQPVFDFDDADRGKVEALMDMVDRHSDRLAGIRLDNTNHEIGTRRNAVRAVLESVTGFPVELDREKKGDLKGVITADACDELEDAFERFMIGKGFTTKQATIAWAELANAALNGFNLSVEQGNASASPPSMNSTEEVSTELVSESGTSTASEPSITLENG